MTYLMPLIDEEQRCEDCIRHRGHWCCTMNCSNANVRPFPAMAYPECVELREDPDGVPRWHLATREGWEITGAADGCALTIKADLYPVGTRIELHQPLHPERKS